MKCFYILVPSKVHQFSYNRTPKSAPNFIIFIELSCFLFFNAILHRQLHLKFILLVYQWSNKILTLYTLILIYFELVENLVKGIYN